MKGAVRSDFPHLSPTPIACSTPVPTLFPAALEAAMAFAVLPTGAPGLNWTATAGGGLLAKVLRLLMGEDVSNEDRQAVQPGILAAATFLSLGAGHASSEARSVSVQHALSAYGAASGPRSHDVLARRTA